jgi:hypothetical protein
MDFRKIRGEKDFSAKEGISMFLIDEHHQRSPKKWGEREREREREEDRANPAILRILLGILELKER